MEILTFILLLLALICLAAAALGVAARIGLGWLGLAFFVAVPFIAAAQALD